MYCENNNFTLRTGNLNIMKEISSISIYQKAFCTLFCIGMISFAGCAADTQESAVNNNTHLVKSNSAELANEEIEPAPEKTVIQEKPPVKKDKPRKLHKGSSYFSFPKESTESKMADFVDSPLEKAPQSFPLDKIKFADADSKLSREAKKQLENVSKIIAAYYGVKLDLYVHPGAGPKTLAKKRATAIREYFITDFLCPFLINICIRIKV